MSGDSIHLMLVEDDENDLRITQRAIRKGQLNCTISLARDGQEALDYLNHEAPFEDPIANPRPSLVLLDINLPKINGVDVLHRIKSNPLLARIPVLMLTTSARQEDVAAAYSHGANGFICKPIRFARFVEVIITLSDYWSLVARVPR